MPGNDSIINADNVFYEGSFTLPIFVRIAVYDNLTSIPRIIDYRYDSIIDFINTTTEKIYNISHEQGGSIPYTIIKEIVENLIHAKFSEVIITILNKGNQIMISDQGPGISNKEKAMLPGFTSATSEMKKFIRGVGSGLPIVKETIKFSGGSIDIKNNINTGTVVILKINTDENKFPDFNIHNKDEKIENSSSSSDKFNKKNADEYDLMQNNEPVKSSETDLNNSTILPDSLKNNTKPDEFDSLKLSLRQIKILYLTLELEESGPSAISRELGFSLSTSFRELAYLEREGFLKNFSSGKKKLTKKGFKYLEYYSNNF
ncbi:MAG: ATP-binding protein [Actinobacteria bacterium]|nr:ATP-binding protein [Actinomycetota bacterium]